MLAKGWPVDGAVRAAILGSLMQHGDSYTLYQHYIDASIAVDELEEVDFDENDNFTDQKIAVLERYIAARRNFGGLSLSARQDSGWQHDDALASGSGPQSTGRRDPGFGSPYPGTH